MPTVAITMGDPAGIGPEIIVKSLSDAARRARARDRVFGLAKAMERAAREAGITPYWTSVRQDAALGERGLSAGPVAGVVVLDDPECESALGPGGEARASAAGGAASYAWVERAIAAALTPPTDARHVDAIVTAPISKTSWDLAGHTEYPGHTELLAAKFQAKRAGMLFVGPSLRVMLATIHVPLMSVGQHLTIGKVFDAIELAAKSLKEMGVERARIAVCGLNPHAGEGGILGEEDGRVIEPAIAAARAKGIDAHGPLPGDTVFNAAAAPPCGKGRYDCVVAMYHDQGLIPVKLLDGYRAVNVTVMDGAIARCVRTSPAHGTAFDIAGKNKADARSMDEAIAVALGMVRRRAGKE